MTTTEAPVLLRTLATIELNDVDDNPWQPRSSLDPEKVKELADSIREVGLLQSPMVRQVPADGLLGRAGAIRYQTAFGHYRIAALKSLGHSTAELEVRQLSDADMAIIALTENRKRTDVAPIEQYRAWQKALEIEGMTIVKLAESMGFDRSTVSNNLRLLKLPEYVLEHVDAGELSAHAAREFLCLMGPDGHFHDTEARSVLGRLMSGTPDWRAVRVRYLIGEDIDRRPVAEWRKVFGTSNSFEGGAAFDVEAFKHQHPDQVHAIPNDHWDGSPSNGKLKEERSRDWTCATKEWGKAQAAGKKAAAAVAEAAPTAKGSAPKPTGDFTRMLANDPLYKTVSPETAGPLLKKKGNAELSDEAAKALGTRAAQAELKRAGFKAYIGEERVYHEYGSNVTEPPPYFDNIAECRKTCTIGATYARFGGKGPFHLFCLNEEHYKEKLEKGKAAARAKLEKKAKERDEKDAHVYALVDGDWTLPPVLTKLMAAHLISQLRAEPIQQEGAGRDNELLVWRANTRRMFGLIDQKPNWWFQDAGKAIDRLSPEDARELLVRILVEHMAATPLEKIREAFGAAAEVS